MSTILNKELLIEIVCEKCPATCWGAKSICRTHDRHVGMIEKCPEWDKYLLGQQGLQEHDGQLAITNMEPAMEWLQKAEEFDKRLSVFRQQGCMVTNRIRAIYQQYP